MKARASEIQSLPVLNSETQDTLNQLSPHPVGKKLIEQLIIAGQSNLSVPQKKEEAGRIFDSFIPQLFTLDEESLQDIEDQLEGMMYHPHNIFDGTGIDLQSACSLRYIRAKDPFALTTFKDIPDSYHDTIVLKKIRETLNIAKKLSVYFKDNNIDDEAKK